MAGVSIRLSTPKGEYFSLTSSTAAVELVSYPQRAVDFECINKLTVLTVRALGQFILHFLCLLQSMLFQSSVKRGTR